MNPSTIIFNGGVLAVVGGSLTLYLDGKEKEFRANGLVVEADFVAFVSKNLLPAMAGILTIYLLFKFPFGLFFGL